MITSATKMFLPSTEDKQFIPVLVTSNLRERGQARLAEAVRSVFSELTESGLPSSEATLLLENLSPDTQKSKTIVIALNFSDENVVAMENAIETPSISVADLKAGILLQLARVKTDVNAKAIEVALIKKNKLKAERAQEAVLEFAIRAYIHEKILTVAEQRNNNQRTSFDGENATFIPGPAAPEPKVTKRKASAQDDEGVNTGTKSTESPPVQATSSIQDRIVESNQHSTGSMGNSTTKASKVGGGESIDAQDMTKPTMAKAPTEQKKVPQNDVPVKADLVSENNLAAPTEVRNKPQDRQVRPNKAGSNSGGSQVEPPISSIKFINKQNDAEVETLKPFKLWTNVAPEKFSPEYDAYQRMKKQFDGLRDKSIEQNVDVLTEPTLQKNRAFSGRNNVKQRSNVEKEPQVENDQINNPASSGAKNRNNRNKKGKQAMAETNIQQDDSASFATNQVIVNTAFNQKQINNLNLIDWPEYSLNVTDSVNTSKDGVVETKEIIYKESHPFGDVVIKLTEEHYQGVRPDYDYGPLLSTAEEAVEATELVTGSSRSKLINLEAKSPPYRFKNEVAAESLGSAEKAKVMERFHKALNELEQHNANEVIKDINNANARQPLLLDDQLTAVQKQLSGSNKQQDAVRNFVADRANEVEDAQRDQSPKENEPTL